VSDARMWVLRAVLIKIQVLPDIAPCHLVNRNGAEGRVSSYTSLLNGAESLRG
jgi:hypothetical protein